MLVKEKEIKINGVVEKKVYPFNGTGYDSLSARLKAEFSDQGEFYEKVFNVSREVAGTAGWEPNQRSFAAPTPSEEIFVGERTLSNGWASFLRDKGKPTIKEERVLLMDVKTLLFGKNMVYLCRFCGKYTHNKPVSLSVCDECVKKH